MCVSVPLYMGGQQGAVHLHVILNILEAPNAQPCTWGLHVDLRPSLEELRS